MSRMLRLTLLLVSLMLLSAVSVSAQEPVHLKFWNYWDGNNGEAIQGLVDQFNADHPDIQVENVFYGWGELLPRLQTAIAGGEAPSLAAVDMAWMPLLANSGKVAALDTYIEAAGIDLTDFYPALLNVNRYNDQLFGLPVSTNNLELLINNDLFTAAGLDPAAPPTTWDELTAAAQACANPDQGVVGMELYTQPGEGLTWQFQVYLWQSGGEFLTADNTAAAFNTPAGLQALNYWKSLIDSGASSLAPWGLFDQGKACMRMDGSWMVSGLASQSAFTFSVAQMPIPADGQPATNMGGEHIVIFNSDEATQQAAFTFVEWLTSTETQIAWDQQTAFMPIRASVAADAGFQAWLNDTEPRLIPYVESQQYAINRPSVQVYPELSDVFSGFMEQALYGQISPEDALASAETAVNALLR
ncbi:MAG: ABC transporter substrate-binding protein [Anaerolineae bacterium]|uniref:ABC transporter substrate-binding protein n=1 Tax=Candidatus Flexifilum breve TaxID=3140694 RepID=UPI001AD10A98|nr:ABC transporter substrate-binding protein [Chloroflexota bacterium]MBN8639106.1 ABC transporter substrate-binding protein [Anaerolineae bacterium]